jgi:hypothetical protein
MRALSAGMRPYSGWRLVERAAIPAARRSVAVCHSTPYVDGWTGATRAHHSIQAPRCTAVDTCCLHTCRDWLQYEMIARNSSITIHPCRNCSTRSTFSIRQRIISVTGPTTMPREFGRDRRARLAGLALQCSPLPHDRRDGHHDRPGTTGFAITGLRIRHRTHALRHAQGIRARRHTAQMPRGARRHLTLRRT